VSYNIPDHWNRITLGELTSATRPICYGVLKPGPYVEDGVPLIRITDISNNDFDGSDLHYISHELDQEFKRSKLVGGEILVSIQGTIGRIAMCPMAYANANISRTIAVIEPDSRVYKPFLYWFLRYYGERELFDAFGATRASLNISTIRALEVPLPPLEEQKRIASILDKADAIRRRRQQAIELADQFLRSVFLDMFGDPATNPKGWPKKKISQIGSVSTGNTPSRKVEKYYGDHLEWIKSDNINTPYHFLTSAEEHLSEEGTKVARIAPEGSILVTCIAGSMDCIGNIAIADRRVAFNQQINSITPYEPEQLYFIYAQLLYNKNLVQNASTKSMKGMVNKSKFSDIELIIPDKVDQQNFNQLFAETNDWIAKLSEQHVKSNAMFNSLSQQAFSGELVGDVAA
jgi:type I restriction enzyme, S subunit